MKPPTFIECSVCGREFGSKSIQIHEPQCLQKLRRTEIPSNEGQQHQPKTKRKKKLSPPLNQHGSTPTQQIIVNANSAPLLSSLQSTYPVTMDSRKINLPKITTLPGGNSKSKETNSRSLVRPKTAILAKPKILNIDYIQYDMSLTRIDFSSSSHSPSPVQGQNIMDENHNHKTTHRLARQNTSVIDPANRSPFTLPAVSPTNSKSVMPTKLYKGINVGLTKLPSSNAINSYLGNPLKRADAAGGANLQGFGTDNFFSRQSGKLSIKADECFLPRCGDFVPFSRWSSGLILMNMQMLSTQSFIPNLPYYIPTDEFHLESPVSLVSPESYQCKSPSFPNLHSISSSQSFLKIDDSSLLETIPQITRNRVSSQPEQELSTVTTAYASANDSKVQDQSQAQRECCGGRNSTGDSERYFSATSQSFQILTEAGAQGTDPSEERKFFENLEQRSSQEIVFLKKRVRKDLKPSVGDIPALADANGDGHIPDQDECQQLFVGVLHSSKSFQMLSSRQLDDIDVHGQGITISNNIPPNAEMFPMKEFDYESEGFEEEEVYLDNNVRTDTPPNAIPYQQSDVIPLMNSIKNVTGVIPPLYASPKSTKSHSIKPNDENKNLLLPTSSKSSTLLQGSGSEGDDEESQNESQLPMKWTSSWTILERKNSQKCTGVSYAKDSVEQLKRIRSERNNEQVSKSGRRLWNKIPIENLEIGKGLGSIVIQETSTATPASQKTQRKVTGQSKNVEPLSKCNPSTAVGKKRLNEREINNEYLEAGGGNVSMWEGSHMNPESVPVEAEIVRRHRSVPTARKVQPKPLKQDPRSTSCQSTMKKPAKKVAAAAAVVERQVISDLVSAVCRLKKLQKTKILEDYLFERPMTQGSNAYNRLGSPFTQIDRPQTCPPALITQQYVSNPKPTKRKCKNRSQRGAFTCLSEITKQMDKSSKFHSLTSSTPRTVKMQNAAAERLAQPKMQRRPHTQENSQVNTIIRVTNRKPPSAIMATQTPRKGERLLTPTKDRKSKIVKVETGTQTPRSSKTASKAARGEDPANKEWESLISTTARQNISVAAIGKSSYRPREHTTSVETGENPQTSLEQISGTTHTSPRRRLTAHRNTNESKYQNSQRSRPKLVFPVSHRRSAAPSISQMESVNIKLHRDKYDGRNHGLNNNTELMYYEGSAKANEISHTVNFVTAKSDDEIDIYYHIFPPSVTNEKKHLYTSRDDTLKKRASAETVVRLSARKVKVNADAVPLRKSSSTTHMLRDEDVVIKTSRKSYSNIELMVPKIPVDATGVKAEEAFVDLNIVVRRKDETGSYPPLEETQAVAADDKMLLLLDETSEEVPYTPPDDHLVKNVSSDTKKLAKTKSNSEAISQVSNKEVPKKAKKQALKFFGQDFIAGQPKDKEFHDNNGTRIALQNADKIPKVLYRRDSKSVNYTCQKISSGAIFVRDTEDFPIMPKKIRDIMNEVYQKSGLSVSAEEAQQLFQSRAALDEFLHDYDPSKHSNLNTTIEGIATGLRYFGLLPYNKKWRDYFTNCNDT